MENGPRIIPEYRKKYLTALTKKEIAPTKKDVIKKILDMPAVLARGFRDDLIEFDAQSEPPVLIWKPEMLEYQQEIDLMMIKNVLENKQGQQTKKF